MRRHHFRYILVLRDFTLTKTPAIGGSIFRLEDNTHPWTFYGAISITDLITLMNAYPDREWLLTDTPYGQNMSFYNLTIESFEPINITGLGNIYYGIYLNDVQQAVDALNAGLGSAAFEASYRQKSELSVHQENTVVNLPSTTYPRFGYVSNNWSTTRTGSSITSITMSSDQTVYAKFSLRETYSPAPPANNEIYITVDDDFVDSYGPEIEPYLELTTLPTLNYKSCNKNDSGCYYIISFKGDKTGSITLMPDGSFDGEICEHITAISFPESVTYIGNSLFGKSSPSKLKSITINSINGIDEKTASNAFSPVPKSCMIYIPKGTTKMYAFLSKMGFKLNEF